MRSDPPPFNSSAGQRAAIGLSKLAVALRHHAWREGAGEELTPTQGQILVYLSGNEAASLADVAEALAVRASTASEATQTLVDKGLVERAKDPADRRRLQLNLSAAGRAAAGKAAGWPDFLASAAAELSEPEQAALLRLVQRMIVSLQRRGQIPSARMCLGCRYFQPHVHRGKQPHHCDFVDRPFGDIDLQTDCPDQEPAPPEELARLVNRFTSSVDAGAPTAH